MKSFIYTVTDPLGLHARPAGALVKMVKSLESSVAIEKAGKTADAAKLFAVMGLAVKGGEEITLTVSGASEEADAAALQRFVAENF